MPNFTFLISTNWINKYWWNLRKKYRIEGKNNPQFDSNKLNIHDIFFHFSYPQRLSVRFLFPIIIKYISQSVRNRSPTTGNSWRSSKRKYLLALSIRKNVHVNAFRIADWPNICLLYTSARWFSCSFALFARHESSLVSEILVEPRNKWSIIPSPLLPLLPSEGKSYYS